MFEGSPPISCSELRENSTNDDLMKKGKPIDSQRPKGEQQNCLDISHELFFIFLLFLEKKKAKCLTLSLALSVFGVDD